MIKINAHARRIPDLSHLETFEERGPVTMKELREALIYSATLVRDRGPLYLCYYNRIRKEISNFAQNQRTLREVEEVAALASKPRTSEGNPLKLTQIEEC